ncbi:assimilatory sulfite reductase (NADPH) flavoprotein subunit [Paraliobacillus sediminis]|uniref:assimilatory sulfite reductase (NADPH) flavoprotein subunit n=1 Tax=Paraliobacillus sediminis TaxID=1885916 RepID=UPI000E3DF3D6|nr:assimilatory sulfite reductase (NADPH) flavoprotein subunit [Paraliobacillus sediminis]
MEFQTTNSIFNQEQVELLNRLVPSLTEQQKYWLSGYLAVSQSGSVVQQPGVEVASVEKKPVEVTVLYGTDTGNSQGLAENMGEQLEQDNFVVTVSSLEDFKPKNLKTLKNLLIVTSTDGEGDPPDNAISFYDFLHGPKAPKLEDLRFSVLSLGDSSYEFFCQTGIDFDKRLEELGGERFYQRIDCDLDFEQPAEEWFSGVLAILKESQGGEQQVSETGNTQTDAATDGHAYSKKNPFTTEILTNLNINGRGSNKETHHLELDLEGSNLQYEPGDSLGIYPENDPVLVDQLIEKMQWDPNERVSIENDDHGDRPLRDALISTLEITILTKPLLEKIAVFTGSEGLIKLAQSDNREVINDYLEGRDLIDLVDDFGPWDVSAVDFIKLLRKIPARLYSIASSLKANPDEVHLTLGTVRYHAHGRDRVGVCSGQCADRLEIGDSLPVFVQSNERFRLPEETAKPIIMIGAGTGVAPYRAFLQEREEIEADGKAWLFFGDQHFVSDFLYQIEWQKWLKDGVLSKMDVAFSRDTDQKVYVQDRMLEQSKELYQWIQDGAHVYVCGDEKHMAKDVQATLLSIFEKEGGMNAEQAELFLTTMRKEKRYQRDVY